MAEYTLANGREVNSEVLLKLKENGVADLPMACKTCPAAMWQITGRASHPEAVTVRCFCRVMHSFTWDSRNREEILDCDQLYQEEEESQDEEEELPAFLRAQRERERQETAMPTDLPFEE
ncbi:hypothetical protein [Pseudomonas protegens]|nr:hypothetical protein [Pseudomonas protegens]